MCTALPLPVEVTVDEGELIDDVVFDAFHFSVIYLVLRYPVLYSAIPTVGLKRDMTQRCLFFFSFR